MNAHKKLLIFFIISFFIHLGFLYLTKPQLLLFSSLQNIKLKKKDLTKVKLIKVKPKKKSKKKSKKKVTKKQKPKKVLKSKKSKLISKSKPKNTKKKTNLKLKKKKVKRKGKTKFKTISKSKTKKKISKPKKVDLSLIHKKVQAIKKKKEEQELKEELKKEAAYFYANKLVSLVQRLWIFPKSIQDSELPLLKIKIKLRVRKDGTIVGEPVIISKSNNKIFNESALRAVKKLYKYKVPLPDIIDEKYIDIILTLTPPEK